MNDEVTVATQLFIGAWFVAFAVMLILCPLAGFTGEEGKEKQG